MSGARAVEVGVLPVPESVCSLLLFGGSFDPPHRGHFELPEMARNRLNLDWLVYMPASRSPFKADAPSATNDQRLEMLQAGLAGAEKTSISTIELSRDSSLPSYTIDSLREIRRLLAPEVKLRLLIGEDQMRQFHNWKEASEIIALAEPAVMLRSGHSAKRKSPIESLSSSWSDAEIEQWGDRMIELPEIDASATHVRELLAQGGAANPELRRMVPDSVLAIIDRDALYRH